MEPSGLDEPDVLIDEGSRSVIGVRGERAFGGGEHDRQGGVEKRIGIRLGVEEEGVLFGMEAAAIDGESRIAAAATASLYDATWRMKRRRCWVASSVEQAWLRTPSRSD